MTRWAASEDRRGGLITRTWADPCPVCGGPVTSLDAEAITVRDNPTAVISIHNPACPYDEDDPDSPDCICTTVINPAPDPLWDEEIVVGYLFTIDPCGHQTQQKIRFYQQTVPARGTLGALLADWAEEGG
jgi:hypothetical protein